MLKLQLEKPLRNQVPSNSQAKKLVLVLATFLLMTGASMRVEDQQLERISFIQYPMQFKGHIAVQALFDFNNEVNAMISAYTAVLRLHVCFTDVKAQKIDRLTILTYSMVLANFQVEDK